MSGDVGVERVGVEVMGWRGTRWRRGGGFYYSDGAKGHQYHTFNHQILHSCGDE